MKRFALIGAAGYVAPRHMKAIKDVGGDLIAAYDPCDSVGVLDQYFINCRFFKDPHSFWKFVKSAEIDYVVICSPNFLHMAHATMCLGVGVNVICEKPLCCDRELMQGLKPEHHKKLDTILQLRYHPEIIKLKKDLENSPESANTAVVTYAAPRGDWYFKTWKGDFKKSGGILMNIGIHFFDLLQHLFGDPLDHSYVDITDIEASGHIVFEHAVVNWSLSIDKNRRPCRSFFINDRHIDLSTHITDLHTKSYEEILAGRGFGVDEATKSVKIVNDIRKIGEIYD